MKKLDSGMLIHLSRPTLISVTIEEMNTVHACLLFKKILPDSQICSGIKPKRKKKNASNLIKI